MRSTLMDPAKPRFLLLDFLRIIGAVAVLFYHYTARQHAQWGEAPSDAFPVLSLFSAYGFLGVHLFFLLSGFVIFFSTEGRTVGQFVAARVSRLYPAYWAAVILTSILIVYIAPQLGRELTLTQILTNLTMVQSAFGVAHVDGVYWTLPIELLFYTMIALLIRANLTEAKVYWFAFGWPVIAAFAQQFDNQLLEALLSPVYASLFAAGMILYLIHSRGHSLLRWMLFVFNALLATQQMVRNEMPARQLRLTGHELSEPVGVALMLLIFASVAVVVLTPLKHRGGAWMSYAGALTFPLYLVHEYWGWWVIGISHETLGKWGALAAAIAVSFALAVILERWVERPLRPRIRAGLLQSFDAIRRPSDGAANAPKPQ